MLLAYPDSLLLKGLFAERIFISVITILSSALPPSARLLRFPLLLIVCPSQEICDGAPFPELEFMPNIAREEMFEILFGVRELNEKEWLI